jgi:cholesterol transport system auxiliary component
MKFIIIIAIFILSGCATIKPSITEYRIITDSLNVSSSVDGCSDKSLKVVQAFSPSTLMSLKMNYAQDESKIFSYSQARWSELPNHSITMSILKEIRDTNFFKNVQVAKSRSNHNWVLEINIEEFLQHYSKDLKNSFSKVVISFTFVDSKTKTIVANKIFTSKVDTDSLNADGGVKALNSALSNILVQNIEWLNEVCK